MLGFLTSKKRAHHRGDALEFAYQRPARRRKDTRHVAFSGAGVPAVLVVGTGGYLGRGTFGLLGLEDVFLGAGEPFRGDRRSAVNGVAERLAVLPSDGHGAGTIPAAAPSFVVVLVGFWFVVVLLLLVVVLLFFHGGIVGRRVAR